MVTRCGLFKIFKNGFINYKRTIRSSIPFGLQLITKRLNVQKINSKYVTNKINRLQLTFGITYLASIWYQLDTEDEVEDNLAHLVSLAKYALERGDVERAEEIMYFGLKLCEDHKLYENTVYLYDVLVTLLLGEGKVRNAEELLVTAIEKMSLWGFPADHNNIIDFKLRLARIYSTNGQTSFAKLGFQNCLEQQSAKIQNGDTSEKTGLLYVHILFWYGIYLIQNELYKEARSMVDTAYGYATKIKGLTPKQEMVILYTLADLNVELGDLTNALAYMLDAIVLAKGIGSVDMPICYLKLGTIYQQIGFYEQAKFAFQEAAKLAKTFGYFDVVMDAQVALQSIVTESDSPET